MNGLFDSSAIVDVDWMMTVWRHRVGKLRTGTRNKLDYRGGGSSRVTSLVGNERSPVPIVCDMLPAR